MQLQEKTEQLDRVRGQLTDLLASFVARARHLTLTGTRCTALFA